MRRTQKPVPRFIGTQKGISGENHIVIGVNPPALCGKTGFDTAEVIPSMNTLSESKDSLCTECTKIWDRISDRVRIEPTEKCIECGTTVHASRARSVEHKVHGLTQLCKSCYEEVYNNSETSVETPYDEKEAIFPVEHDREYTVPEDIRKNVIKN